MTYELAFVDAALKEWRKLDGNTRERFKKKLAERCENPRVPSAKLSGVKDRYNIKLRGVGYRLVYEVREAEILVVVMAIGKRWIMCEAIAQYVEREEKREALRQDTLKAWDEFQATGQHATAEEVEKWLASWGTENELPTPLCQK
jgi:mRNA interferase RelE/StbE